MAKVASSIQKTKTRVRPHFKKQETQVNMLIYSMGEQPNDILGATMTEKSTTQYQTSPRRESLCLAKKPYLRMKKFNMYRQEEGEPVDSFITSLYRLVEHCNYHDLDDEMIQDRIVVSL